MGFTCIAYWWKTDLLMNKGITADVKTKEGQSFEQALAISRTPGYEWLRDIKNNKNVNWAFVKMLIASGM